MRKRPNSITTKVDVNDPNEAKAAAWQTGHKKSIGEQGADYPPQHIFSMMTSFKSMCSFQPRPDHRPWDEFKDLREECSLWLDWKQIEKNVWCVQ